MPNPARTLLLLISLMLAAGYVSALTGTGWLFPALVPAAVALAVGVGWIGTGRAVRTGLDRPVALRWVGGAEPPVPPWADATDAELRELGFQRLGQVARPGGSGEPLLVYAHSREPTYALLAHRPDHRPMLHLETFWEGGGRLSTTAEPRYGRYTSWWNGEGARLVQVRPGGSAAALEGQHQGTLHAWQAGGRRPLEATRKALIGYLDADRERLRQGLERGIPLGCYVRALLGAPRGVLRF